MRILPYGEPDNDWLTLDSIYRRRGQVLAPIGNSNFIGEVLVTRGENVLLIDTASREGVLENEAFHELQTILRDSLVWAVNRVAAIRQKKISAGGTAERAPTAREALLEDISAAAQRVTDAQNDDERVVALAQFAETTTAALREARRSDRRQDEERLALLDELSLLRVLASVGSAIAVFSHEVRAVLTQAIAAVGDVATDIEEASVPTQETIHGAESGLQGVFELATYLDIYISHSGRRVREEQPLAAVLAEFEESTKPLLDRRGIELTSEVHPSHLRTKSMSRSELIAMLYNLLTNALKALDDEDLTERRILIVAAPRGNSVVIQFLDTGTGIDGQIRDRMFDAFVTTTNDSDAELGAGTGLGLKIVADLAESNGGSASIGDAKAPFVTCMEITLPMSSGSSDLG
jgi:signal transduction histidine kinase